MSTPTSLTPTSLFIGQRWLYSDYYGEEKCLLEILEKDEYGTYTVQILKENFKYKKCKRDNWGYSAGFWIYLRGQDKAK